MARKGQKFKKHTIEQKKMIVNEKLTTGRSYSTLERKYGISAKTIVTWVLDFNRTGVIEAKTRGRQKSDTNIDYKEKYEILKKYIDFMEEVDREKK